MREGVALAPLVNSDCQNKASVLPKQRATVILHPPSVTVTCRAAGELNFDITDNSGLVKQTEALCPAQTSGSLSHPPRSWSESICVGQCTGLSVRVGPLSRGPRGGVCPPPPPCPRSHTGQPNEPTLMGLQPHCSTAHSGERGYSARLGQGRERVNGTFHFPVC